MITPAGKVVDLVSRFFCPTRPMKVSGRLRVPQLIGTIVTDRRDSESRRHPHHATASRHGSLRTVPAVRIRRALGRRSTELAPGAGMSLLAVSLALLVACGGGQTADRGDAADGGRRDGPSERVMQPTTDA